MYMSLGIADVTLVDTMELENESWEFHECGIFYHEDTETYWIGFDSGCSCPTPWDGFQFDEDDGPLTAREALRRLDDLCMNHDNKAEGWFVDAYRSTRATLQAHIFANR